MSLIEGEQGAFNSDTLVLFGGTNSQGSLESCFYEVSLNEGKILKFCDGVANTETKMAQRKHLITSSQ